MFRHKIVYIVAGVENMSNNYPQFMPVVSKIGAGGARMTVYMDVSPYPEVKGGKDAQAVALLKEDYAGMQGELTAVAQYVFQNGRASDNETFANSVLQIAIVEMMHLDMLGDAIVALGGEPEFDDGKYFWNAGYVNYSKGYADMLKADIAAEKTAIENYLKHAAAIKNDTVKALLERIVVDERLHLRFFTEELGKIGG